jgi:hypothetical protein
VTHGEFAAYDEDDGTIVDDFDQDTGVEEIDAEPRPKTIEIGDIVIDISDIRPGDGEDDFDEDDEYEDDDEDEDDMDEAAKARLAAALAEIDAKFGRPPSEQVAAFAEAHQTLQATLNRIDTP